MIHTTWNPACQKNAQTTSDNNCFTTNISIEKPKGIYKCPICQSIYKSSASLSNHKRHYQGKCLLAKKNEKFPKICDMCKKSYKDRVKFKNHQRYCKTVKADIPVDKSKIKNKLTCCSQGTSSAVGKVYGIKISDKTVYEDCLKYVSQGSIVPNIFSKNANVIYQVPFENEQAFQDWLKNISGDFQICKPACDEEKSVATNLNSENPTTPISNNDINNDNTSLTLQTNINTSKNNEQTSKYQCPTCLSMYKSKRSLYKHTRAYKNTCLISMKKHEVFPKICNTCNKSFENRVKFLNHKRNCKTVKKVENTTSTCVDINKLQLDKLGGVFIDTNIYHIQFQTEEDFSDWLYLIQLKTESKFTAKEGTRISSKGIFKKLYCKRNQKPRKSRKSAPNPELNCPSNMNIKTDIVTGVISVTFNTFHNHIYKKWENF